LTKPAYIIGIDLGTTNSVVAYTKSPLEKGSEAKIRLMAIPQLVDAGVVEKREVLPSFILLPGSHDVSADGLKLPWDVESRMAVGEFARDRGTEIPHRLISSAKSWLCNPMVDRNAPLLPWSGSETDNDLDNTFKLSVVQASSAILDHIRKTWNYTIANTDKGHDPALEMENQDVFITVPASFDAVARDLTVKAAAGVGLKNITLIEEPVAAFYAWIASCGDKWRKMIKTDDLILVCDVGGGTTDFSLIQVTDVDGDMALERVAVGNHLLVGGDNMDLSLSYAIYHQLVAKGTKLDAWQMRGLSLSCRKAKELILSDPDCQEYPVTILGRGSRLIGGVIKTSLQKKAVEDILIEGFFPRCARSDKPMRKQAIGIKEFGLAYEADPAVTRHMAQFIGSQDRSEAKSGGLPTAILFNGGVMKSKMIRNRVLETIASWQDDDVMSPIREIENADFDLAVARGAAYYGVAKRGDGIRIRGGLNQSYYIGIAAAMPAVPGMPARLKALCVAPFGMEEGTSIRLSEREFTLVTGESAKFDFLGSSIRKEDRAGTVIENWEDDIEAITTLETVLEGETGNDIPVTLAVTATEIGTLEIWCLARDDDRRWKLEFNVRAD
jgi:hypothetical protein